LYTGTDASTYILCFISILSFGNKFETKRFLWADDLSSFDSIYELPFHVPCTVIILFFPILASIAIFFYINDNWRSTNGRAYSGRDADMAKMMKIMIYVSLMMLFFFNSYASGLSLYYFISNTITIGIMLSLKIILSTDKIHAQIQENKKKSLRNKVNST
jgi:YidC/Oxa1 family membrane protein insertase